MSQQVYTQTITTARTMMSFINLPDEPLNSVIKIAKRMPNAPDLPAMWVLRHYLVYEQETALQFILEHALQNSDPAEELLKVQAIVIGGVVHLTLWEDADYPDVFAAIHFDEMPPMEEVEHGLDRVREVRTRMLLCTSGKRIFQCPHFSRDDYTLERWKTAPKW